MAADRSHGVSPWRTAYEGLLQATVSRSNGRGDLGAYSESLERDSKGIVKPVVSLRVCDEFPTAEAVQAELERRFDYLAQKYALPNGDRWTGEGAIRDPFNGDAVATEQEIPF